MSNVIQCPKCAKKFRLPERVPPTFACTQCGTLMDLSAFAGAAAAAPVAPAAAEPRAPSSRSSRTRGAGRSAGPSGPAPSGSRRSRRGATQDDDGAGGGRRGGRERKQGNPALIIGSVTALVAAVVLILVMSKKDDPEPTTPIAKGPGAASTGGVASPVNTPMEAGEEDDPADAPAAAKPVKTPAKTTEKPPEATKEARGMGRINVSQARLQVFAWPDEVDQATRDKVEELIPVYMRGDRWSKDACTELLAMGRPIAGRLISEWKHVEDQLGLDTREGKSRVMAIETLLRQMDGWIERYWKQDPSARIRHSSDHSYIDGQIKRWVAWWEQDIWKTKPLDPWVETEDGSDLSEEERAKLAEEERKRAKEEQDKEDGGEFGKRAGG